MCFFVSVPMVTLNSTTISTNEGDGSFQVCIDVDNQTIKDGQTVSFGYTFQDADSKLCIIWF